MMCKHLNYHFRFIESCAVFTGSPMQISNKILDVLKMPWTNHITSGDHGKSSDLVFVTASNQHYFRGMYPVRKNKSGPSVYLG